MDPLADRLQRHARLQRACAAMSDADLIALRDAAAPRTGWGTSRPLVVDGLPVFAKSIPVTDAEHAAGLPTANLFELPLFYSYGVGSAGFGAGRELAVHDKTTAWVRNGDCPHFPMMAHHRLLPVGAGHKTMVGADLAAYVAKWGDSAAVGRFMEARNSLQHEVLVLLEWVPHVLFDWLPTHAEAAPAFVEQVGATVRFLAAQGVVHFDAHAGNILTDGQQFFLTDFGLALDRAFDLTSDERAFLDRHLHYDRGQAVCGLMWPLGRAIEALSDDARAVLSERCGGTRTADVGPHVAGLVADGLLDLPTAFVDTLGAHWPVIEAMMGWFDAIQQSDKTAVFPDATVADLLPR